MTKTLGLLGIAGALSASAYSCPFCYDPKGLHIGETKVLGNGTVYSWVKLDDKGNPTGVGITATAMALEGLPMEKPSTGFIGYEIPLKLPAEAKDTPFNHVAFDWNPLGHIPPGIYDVPHFDAHFYLMTPEERNNITLVGEDLARTKKATPPGVMPDGYIMAPGGEEKYMGMHWGQLSWPEFNGKPFVHSFIYGSYDGKLAFIEPMFTLAFLKSKPQVVVPFPQPKLYPAGKYFPTTYRISFDEKRQEYTIALEGMVKR